MVFDDLLHDGKSEPDASRPVGSGGVETNEWLDDIRDPVLRDARTVVDDINRDGCAFV